MILANPSDITQGLVGFDGLGFLVGIAIFALVGWAFSRRGKKARATPSLEEELAIEEGRRQYQAEVDAAVVDGYTRLSAFAIWTQGGYVDHWNSGYIKLSWHVWDKRWELKLGDRLTLTSWNHQVTLVFQQMVDGNLARMGAHLSSASADPEDMVDDMLIACIKLIIRANEEKSQGKCAPLLPLHVSAALVEACEVFDRPVYIDFIDYWNLTSLDETHWKFNLRRGREIDGGDSGGWTVDGWNEYARQLLPKV